ncbi:MAG: pimeloyl-CoA dehydrogenase small subunit, partial [Pseudomonadales bacterium]
MVDSNTAGLSQRDYATVDGLRASELTIDNVSVSDAAVVGTVNNGYELMERVIDMGIVAVSAEAVGAMEVLYKTTVEY